MIESGDIIVRRPGPQGPRVETDPLPQHGPVVGMVDTDELESEVGVSRMAGSSQPFLLEVQDTTLSPFIIDDTPFELEVPGPVIVDFPAQLLFNDTHAVPWNYQPPSLLIDGQRAPEEEVTAITQSGRVVPERSWT